MQDQPNIKRSCRSRLFRPLPDNERAKVNKILRLWHEYKIQKRAGSINCRELRAFAYWLTVKSGKVVPTYRHLDALARLSAQLSAGNLLLAQITSLDKDKAAVTFRLAQGGQIVGNGNLKRRQLPKRVELGSYVLMQITRPRCAVCGHGPDRSCEGGCYWVKANLCSSCESHGRGRRRRDA